MAGLTSAVDWWQEWQLRILVLTSTAVQVLLLIFSSLRRFSIPGWARSITWLAYLAGDAVAIYALATLFNRHRGGSNIVNTLEVMWAPVLLIHLGGQDGITAYNIEDNELWSRHLVTAVSQVTVAIYVFCKSWPAPGGDKRLLAAAVLLFIPGVLKCFVKPWALKSASIYSLVISDAVKQFMGRDEIYSLEEYVAQAKEFVDQQEQEHGDDVVDDVATSPSVEDADLSNSQGRLCAQLLKPLRNYWRSIKEKENDKLVKQSQENTREFEKLGVLMEGTWEVETWVFEDQPASFCALLFQVQQQLVEIRKRLLVLGEASYKLFVDLSSPYRLRLNILKYCWGISEGRVYGHVERWLAAAFLRLYTKLKTAGVLTESDLAAANNLLLSLNLKDTRGRVMFGCRQLIYCSRLVLPLVSIGLFHQSHSHSKAQHIDDVDVNVTYAIFCCTAVLEICSVLAIVVGEVASWNSVSSSRESGGNWPEMVAQYSLIGYFASYKNHSKWMDIAERFGCADFVDRRMLCMKSCSSSAIISRLVLGYLKYGWKTEIQDARSYCRFSDHNSHWVLIRKKEEKSSSGWVLELERNQCSSQVPGMTMMKWTLSFDECVLIWHIATYICFFSSESSPRVSKHRCGFAEVRTACNKISWLRRTRTNEQQHHCSQESAKCKAVLCRQMSNYMVYLLFVNPEMLLPGSRRYLFIDAYIELNYIIKDMDNVKEDEESVTKSLIDTLETRSRSKDEPREEGGRLTQKDIDDALAPLLDDAYALAQKLLNKNNGDEKKMWEEIQRVWVEMLCFSASRCRGYLHAKALGEGGEFLSYVWLTLFHMGMETFADKLHREKAAGNNAADTTTTTPSTSEQVTSTTTGAGAPSTSSDVHTAAPSTSDICIWLD